MRKTGTSAGKDNDTNENIQNEDDEGSGEHDPENPYARSLRHRKPIQLNPYLIEQARYKRTLQASGLKPVRLKEVEEEVEKHQPHVQQDSSQEEYDGSLPVEEESQERRHQRQRSSSGSTGHHSSHGATISHPIPTGAAILRGIAKDSDSNKRRKLLHTYGSKLDPKTTDSSAQTKLAHSQRDHTSRTTSIELTRESLNEQSGPLIDSDFEEEEPQDSINQQQRRPPFAERKMPTFLAPPSPASSSTESDSDEDLVSADLRILGRKTRGVLPASYHVFNHDEKKSNHHKPHKQAKVVPVGPGIARTIKSSRPRSRDRDLPVVDEDDSESDSPLPVQTPFTRMNQRPTISSQPRQDTGLQQIIISDDDDIMEDDRIDAMLPGTTRGASHPIRKAAQGSSKGLKGRGSTKPKSNKPSTHGSGKKQTRLGSFTRHSTGRKRTKTKAPRIGIIDAYYHHMSKANADSSISIKPPDFLRIARREAIKRKDLGRTGPEGKLFVLDTVEATKDLQSTLRNWRENTLGYDERSYNSLVGEDTRRRRLAQKWTPSAPRSAPRINVPPATRRPANLPLNRTAPKLQTKLLFNAAAPAVNNPSPTEDKNPKHTRLAFGRGGVLITGPRQNLIRDTGPRIRPGDTEGPAGDYYEKYQRAFTGQPFSLIEALLSRGSEARPLPQSRNITKPSRAQKEAPLFQSTHTLPTPDNTTSEVVPRRPKLQRKHRPHHIDTAALDNQLSQQIFERFPTPSDSFATPNEDATTTGPLPRILHLKGFPVHAAKFTRNFGIWPPRSGTYFNHETFLGSHEFARALSTSSYRMSNAGDMPAEFKFNNFSLVWGTYDDSVASGFEAVMEHIMERLDSFLENDSDKGSFEAIFFLSRTYEFFRFSSNYVSTKLSFADAIDVKDFGHRWMRVLKAAFERVCGIWTLNSTIDASKASTQLALQCLTFMVILALEIHLITAMDRDLQGKVDVPAFMQAVTVQLIKYLMSCGARPLQACFEDQRKPDVAERGIGSEHYVVEIWVIVARLCSNGRMPFQTIYTDEINRFLRLDRVETIEEFDPLENIWSTVFSLLPVGLFNDFGVLDACSETPQLQNWPAVRAIVGRTFSIYENSADQGKLNEYIRAIFYRCHLLISRWKWTRCADVLVDTYKFFTRREITDLTDEVDRGSASFLRDLAGSPNTEPQESDSTFQLFLKTVAAGIGRLREILPEKKVGQLVYQMLPNANHNRKYPRDQEIRIEHFTLLRNHHDLLCTLYWVAPERFRPPIDAISSLVDPGVAHRRACSISIRAWSNLIRFQLHDNATPELIEPFMAWFENMVNQIFEQHQSARSEAVKEFEKAQLNGLDVSVENLEAHVRRNQRQIESLLTEAIHALAPTFAMVQASPAVRSILLSPTITTTMFDASYRISHRVVMESIKILDLYLDIRPPQQNSTVIHQDSEESQDYGDLSGFEDLLDDPEFGGPIPPESLEVISYPNPKFNSAIH